MPFKVSNTASSHPRQAARSTPASVHYRGEVWQLHAVEDASTAEHCVRTTERRREDLVAAAREVGITAVWTGNYCGTVQVARLAGPQFASLTRADVGSVVLPGDPPWALADPRVRARLYEWVLTEGTPFDCYRWIDLACLAEVWHLIELPRGVHSEWDALLRACGLGRLASQTPDTEDAHTAHPVVPRQQTRSRRYLGSVN